MIFTLPPKGQGNHPNQLWQSLYHRLCIEKNILLTVPNAFPFERMLISGSELFAIIPNPNQTDFSHIYLILFINIYNIPDIKIEQELRDIDKVLHYSQAQVMITSCFLSMFWILHSNDR